MDIGRPQKYRTTKEHLEGLREGSRDRNGAVGFKYTAAEEDAGAPQDRAGRSQLSQDFVVPLVATRQRRHISQVSHYLLTYNLFVVPPTRTTIGRRYFAVSGPVRSGPATWNSLPVELRTSTLSTETFVKRVKSYLFGCPSEDSVSLSNLIGAGNFWGRGVRGRIWVRCCFPEKGLFSSWHSSQTKRSNITQPPFTEDKSKHSC